MKIEVDIEKLRNEVSYLIGFIEGTGKSPTNELEELNRIINEE